MTTRPPYLTVSVTYNASDTLTAIDRDRRLHRGPRPHFTAIDTEIQACFPLCQSHGGSCTVYVDDLLASVFRDRPGDCNRWSVTCSVCSATTFVVEGSPSDGEAIDAAVAAGWALGAVAECPGCQRPGAVHPTVPNDVESLDALPVGTVLRGTDGSRRGRTPAGRWAGGSRSRTGVRTADLVNIGTYKRITWTVIYRPDPAGVEVGQGL